MFAKLMRRVLFVAVLGTAVSLAARANAQCCGGGGYTSYYQPAAYTTYSPVSYNSYYGGGWYPGYWLNRIRARLWGSPTTYVASYPSTHYASYAPSYSVGYRPAYSAGYSASYAAPAAGCSSCSSCPSYSVGYASPCSTCAPSSACATCAPAVSQAVYQPSSGCASCSTPATVVAPSQSAAPQQSTSPQPQSTYGQQNGAPALDPGASVPPQRQDAQRPTNGSDIQPEPAAEEDPYKVNGDPSTYFQAPKLFDPNDRTAERRPSAVSRPVTLAVYEKPVGYRNVSVQRITAEQAEADAAGWVSASK